MATSIKRASWEKLVIKRWMTYHICWTTNSFTSSFPTCKDCRDIMHEILHDNHWNDWATMYIMTFTIDNYNSIKTVNAVLFLQIIVSIQADDSYQHTETTMQYATNVSFKKSSTIGNTWTVKSSKEVVLNCEYTWNVESSLLCSYENFCRG